MGRPRKAPPADPTASVAVEQIKQDAVASQELARLEQGITLAQLSFTERFGMFRMNRLTRKFLDVIDIRMLINWKESQEFKGLRARTPDGLLITINNFEDLCGVIGISRHTAYEWIENYQALGEDFLREADAAGIGVRDLRRLRKLPPEEIAAAQELLNTDGKEAVIEFVQDLCVKHGQEKQVLEQRLADLQADTEAREKVIAGKNKKLDALDRELTKLRRHTDDWHPRAFEICMETTRASAEALQAADRLHALRDAILTEDLGAEREAAIEAMACVYYDAVHQFLVTANELADACQEVFIGYKDRARPLLNMVEVFGEYQVEPKKK